MNPLLVQIVSVLCLKTTNTYDFNTLSAWWLRNGVFDETMGGKGLQETKKKIKSTQNRGDMAMFQQNEGSLACAGLAPAPPGNLCG